MSDDNPHSSNGSSSKNWIDRISQIFTGEPQSRDELVEVIQDAEERELINEDTKDMIEGVLEVSELKVRDVMIPRSQMVTIEVDQSVDEFLPMVIQTKHSRYPVVSEDKDHVEGILLVKDLLEYGFSKDKELLLADVLRPAVIVPESKRVDVLLKEFRSDRYHMSIVVDEYGGVSGLITIEDILELIVGEIEDEKDTEDQADIRKLNNRVYAVEALTPLEEFNEFFETNFDEEDADTIGGIVLHAFGHMPARDEQITINDYQFRVTNADNRRLIQLQVTLPDSDTPEPVEE